MNNLMKFENNNVEVFEFKGKALFNSKDVAKCLDIADVNSSIRSFNEKQVIKLTNSIMHDMHFRKLHNTGENFLTESGVYKLIFKSHKEDAEKFQDWVTDTVLPDIRKHGLYATDNVIDKILDNPDFGIKLLTKYRDEKQARKLAEQQRDKLLHSKKLYTTSEIAKEIGLRSANELNKKLGKMKTQYKVNKTWVLSADYSEKGYTSIKQGETDNGHIYYDRKWTGIGRDFILNLFNTEEDSDGNNK